MSEKEYVCVVRTPLYISDRISCLISLIESIEDLEERAEYWSRLRKVRDDSIELDMLIEELSKKLGLVVKYVYTR